MASANLLTVHDECQHFDCPAWARLKAGDPAALGYFYDRYVDSLFAFAIRITGNREMAEDAIQEVFVGLWQYRSGIGHVSHSLAYLQKSLRNMLIRQLNAGFSQSGLSGAEELISPEANEEAKMILYNEETETRHRLAGAVQQLSQRQRLIITLHYYEGLSYEQIAERLRMNYQSVNNLAYRTMLRLRHHLLLLFVLGLMLT